MDFFPEYLSNVADRQKREITIGRLLTLTAPYPFEDWREPLDKLYKEPDWVKYTLDMPGQGGTIGAPGRTTYLTLGGLGKISGNIATIGRKPDIPLSYYMSYNRPEVMVMQINRLFEIIYILLNKKTTTAKELAERFEVSVRTIYRDIDTLSAAGIPIYASQGKGGGISLLDDYVLNKSVLSESEQNEILFALQSLNAAQSPETDKVLSKLSDFFHKGLVNWIEVDFSPWGSGKNGAGQFTTLKNAILNHRIIEFDYLSSSGAKGGRRVEPVKLIFKVRAWYLRGFCLSKNAYRTFKISRLSNLRMTQEIFTARAQADTAEDGKEISSQKWIPLRLRISPRGAYRVYDEFDVEQITQNPDGSLEVEAVLPESEWLLNYLLSFGADMEVLAPEPIRSSIQNRLEEILLQYQNKKR